MLLQPLPGLSSISIIKPDLCQFCCTTSLFLPFSASLHSTAWFSTPKINHPCQMLSGSTTLKMHGMHSTPCWPECSLLQHLPVSKSDLSRLEKPNKPCDCMGTFVALSNCLIESRGAMGLVWCLNPHGLDKDTWPAWCWIYLCINASMLQLWEMYTAPIQTS